MSETNNQFNSALNAAEEARQKAQKDAERHAAEIAARAQYHQQLAERATKMSAGSQSFTENVASAARSARDFFAPIGQGLMNAGTYAAAGLGIAGAHIYSGVSRGAGFVGAQISQAAPSAASAFGLGEFTMTGPQSRGISGPYLQAGQSFGGMLYEAGLGQALNSATGGLFFRDVNQVVGLPPALVRQRAQEELSMRARSIGSGFIEAIPGSSVMGFRFAGLASETRRDVAERLSFVTGAAGDNALAGGRGVSATGQLTTTVMTALDEAGTRYDRVRGFSLSTEEERSFRRATLNMFDTPELQNLTKAPSSEVKRKMTQAREVVNKLTEDLRISAGEAEKLMDQFGKMLGPDMINRLSSASRKIVQGGSAGGLSGSQIMATLAQQTQAGFQLGMNDVQASGFAQSFMAERGAVLAQRRAGLITTGDLYMYGGANADEAASRIAQANRRIGTQLGMGDPGRSAMYANRSGNAYLNQLAAGTNAGGLIGFLGAQANVTVADPYAALRAQYDPDAKQRAATTGRLAAFQAAKQQAQFTHLFKTGDPATDRKNARALAIQAFQQGAGIQDPVEAARQYDMMQMAEQELGDSKKAFLYNEMQQVGAHGMDLDRAKKVTANILEAVGGDVNKFANASDIEKRQIINQSLVLDVGLTDTERSSVRALAQASAGAMGNGAVPALTEAQFQQEERIALDEKFGLDRLRGTALSFGRVGSVVAGAAGGILTGMAAGAVAGSAFLGIGAVPGAIIGGAVGFIDAATVGQEQDIEKTVQQLVAAGAPVSTINAQIEQFGYFVTPDGDLRSSSDPGRSRAAYFGVSDDVGRAILEYADEASKTGRIPKTAVVGAAAAEQRERVREITGTQSLESYLESNESIRKRTGAVKTAEGDYGYTEDQRAQLMQDKNFLEDVKKAAEITGDTELLEDIKSGRQKDSGGIQQAAANRLLASDKLQDAMVNIRVEREASTLKAAPLGSRSDKPMFVKQVDE